MFVMEIRDNIDPRMNRYVELALDQATEEQADLVIIDMDTYGGAVNDANDIRTRILDYEKPVWVYINNNAASAGALISIACDSIYMVPGANIGAATVVNGVDGTQAPDKYQSYFRSIIPMNSLFNSNNNSFMYRSFFNFTFRYSFLNGNNYSIAYTCITSFRAT